MEPVDFLIIPNPKNKVVLLTNNSKTQNNINVKSIDIYRHSKFVWLDIEETEERLTKFNETYLQRIDESSALAFLNQNVREYHKIPNFGGKEIHIAVINNSVYSQVGTPDENGLCDIADTAGFQLSTILSFADILNLKPILHCSINQAGFIHQNGTVEPGANENVKRWLADIAITGKPLMAMDVYHAEFMVPFSQGCVRFLVPRPQLSTIQPRIILHMLTYNTWICLALSIIIMSIITSLFARVRKNYFAKRYRSLLESLFNTVFHLIQKQYPRTNETRRSLAPLFASWSIFAMLISIVIISQLTANFTSPRLESKVQTIQGFIDNGYSWGVLNSYYSIHFNQNNETEKLWESEKYFKKIESRDDLHQKMKSRKYVVMMESLGTIFYLPHEAPDEEIASGYDYSDQCYITFLRTVLFPPGSPYAGAFNFIMRRLRQTGITQWYYRVDLTNKRVLRKFISRVNSGTNRADHHEVPLSLHTMRNAFFVLIVGVVISTIAYFRENSKNNSKEPSKKRKSKEKNRKHGGNWN